MTVASFLKALSFGKENVKEDSYIATLGVVTSKFFVEIDSYLKEKFENYTVILRLNCEGMEDEVIYSAHRSLGNNLKLICGSLKDVREVKGMEASNKLDEFIKEKDLEFVYFYSGIDSWPNAHKKILSLIQD